MLCSSCSQTVAPVVAVDIDGTLGDYHGHFIRFASEYLDAPKPRPEELYTGRVGFRDWAMEFFGIDARTWYDIKLAYRQGAQKRSMPRYPGAFSLCKYIRDFGAELWLTTTRPYLRLDNIDPDTRAWLARNQIGYDALLYDDNKYDVLAERIDPDRVVAILDDLPEQIEAARKVWDVDVPILRANHYNSATNLAGKTLVEARTLISHRIERWREEHE